MWVKVEQNILNDWLDKYVATAEKTKYCVNTWMPTLVTSLARSHKRTPVKEEEPAAGQK